jgi:hypothetical protein
LALAGPDRTAARARELGIEVADGGLYGLGSFACVLPRCKRRAVLIPRPPYWLYACECLSKPVDLASIRAYRGYGKRLPGLKGVELARWRERLDYEAGLTRCRLAPIELPEQASAIAHRMADGCRLLVGLRDDRWNTEEFTLARNFSKAWCALTDAEAQAARAEPPCPS